MTSTELKENCSPAFTNNENEKPEPENMTNERISKLAFQAVYADKL